jgi:hypothetical protein
MTSDRWPGLLLALPLLACSPGDTLDEAECPPGGTALTYEGFVAPFLAESCGWCHGASVSDRHGAPTPMSSTAKQRSWPTRTASTPALLARMTPCLPAPMTRRSKSE